MRMGKAVALIVWWALLASTAIGQAPEVRR